MEAGYHYTLGNVSWRTTPTDKLEIVNHAAWMREKSTTAILVVFGSAAAITANGSGPARPRGCGTRNVHWIWVGPCGKSATRASQINTNRMEPSCVCLDRFNGTATRAGGYAQQSWTGLSGRAHLTAGARWDYESLDRVRAVSPQASASLALTSIHTSS